MDSQDNPYQSPQAIDAAAVPLHHEPWVRPYASGHTRAMWVMSLLALLTILMVLLLGCYAVDIQLLRRITHETPDKYNSVLRGLSIVKWGHRGIQIPGGLVGLAMPIAFLMWIHRAHRNLPALRAGPLRYSPRWAVGYFFIPILNLIRPYQVMREIWRESDPARLPAPGDDLEATKVSSAAIVGWWWGTFLLMLIARQAVRPFCGFDTPDALVASMWIGVAIAIIGIAAAVVAIVMVYRVDAHQSRRYAIISEQPDAAKTSPYGTRDNGLIH